MNTIQVRELSANSCPVKVAIFDFDGTISTLRCGWEQVMEEIMLNIEPTCTIEKIIKPVYNFKAAF